jgi:hypothetical protein
MDNELKTLLLFDPGATAREQRIVRVNNLADCDALASC